MLEGEKLLLTIKILFLFITFHNWCIMCQKEWSFHCIYIVTVLNWVSSKYVGFNSYNSSLGNLGAYYIFLKFLDWEKLLHYIFNIRKITHGWCSCTNTILLLLISVSLQSDPYFMFPWKNSDGTLVYTVLEEFVTQCIRTQFPV